MNYKIITDEQQLTSFIEWLPELSDDESFYLALFARSKYCKDLVHIKSDKAQMSRFHCRKDKLLQRIKQLECPLGNYSHHGVIVPQEALALYITVNPRSITRATKNSVRLLMDLCFEPYNNYFPEQIVMSEIQKSKSRTCYVDFDMDSKNLSVQDLKDLVYNFVGKSANVQFLESRGGYHILVDPSSVEFLFKSSWYQKLSALHHVDQTGDLMIPVPGTYQGGFTPKFIN